MLKPPPIRVTVCRLVILLVLGCVGSALPAVLATPAPAAHLPATDPQPSAGCTQAPPEEWSTITVGGVARSFISVVPEDYDPGAPHALIFAFHGRTSPAEEVRSYYGLEPHTETTLGQVIFVYPRALTQADGTFGWWEAGEAPDALRDFALFDTLLAGYAERYCLELNRVYAVGHSLGGSFVNALGCERAPVLRAVASLGSGSAPPPCTGEVAAMVLHNPNDELVDFTYGEAALAQYLTQNGLQGPSTPTEPRSLNCEHYSAAGVDNPAQSPVQNPVVWCPHTQDTSYGGRYYPHNWPQETGEAVIRFFSALP